ncbi:MAG: hypothetical protein IKX82_00825, partial [Bacilli bacterium]|nr:hypothetical protein [Bacilli bacterium]
KYKFNSKFGLSASPKSSTILGKNLFLPMIFSFLADMTILLQKEQKTSFTKNEINIGFFARI